MLTKGFLALTIAAVFIQDVCAQTASFRIDRIISGTRLIGLAPDISIEDAKTVFDVPQDKEVVVYFEWTGTAGSHRFEGVWKNPLGAEIGRSEFTATSLSGKFSGSWKLLLTEST